MIIPWFEEHSATEDLIVLIWQCNFFLIEGLYFDRRKLQQ